jgi:diguanylate cyclase (GGDEF)-like protein
MCPTKFARWTKFPGQWTKIETMKQLVGLISTDNVEEMLEHIHAMIALVERDGTLVSWNRAFGSFKKLFPAAKKLEEFFSQNEKDQVVSRLTSNIKEHWVVNLPIPMGEEEFIIYCDCLLIPMSEERVLFIAEEVNSDSAFQGVVERLNRQVKMFQIESEVTKKIARNKQIEMEAVMVQAQEVAQIDALTFLPNRRMIVRELQDEVLRTERYNSPFSISVVDVDFFKKVNDTYGHLAGDEVLRHVGYTLRDHIRHPDIAGRYGGEEFLILLPNTASAEAAEQAERLLKYVRETQVQVNDHIVNVTISIGVAQFQPGVDTWDTLLNRADNAMYDAKSNGRDCWVVAK